MDIDGVHYVFVASVTDDCIQIIDVSDPEDPVAAFAYTDMYDTMTRTRISTGLSRLKALSRTTATM
jgi:hypothetical protein